MTARCLHCHGSLVLDMADEEMDAFGCVQPIDIYHCISCGRYYDHTGQPCTPSTDAALDHMPHIDPERVFTSYQSRYFRTSQIPIVEVLIAENPAAGAGR